MEEIWKDIPGYEGYYQVSTLGRIRDVDRVITRSDGNIMTRSGKIRKLDTTTKKYPYIGLHKNNKLATLVVHRLVARVFIPNPDNLPQINHKDGNKFNNHVDNLEWCTNQQNVLHAMRNGLAGGTKRSCLTKEQAIEVKSLLNSGHRQCKIAERLGISSKWVHSISKGKTWRYV